MNARIVATGVSLDASAKGSIAHAAAAGRACLEAAGVGPDDVDVLVDVGVYRDANMVEPSMAALIQRELGIHLDYVKYPRAKAAFSFDLMNGACGLVHALDVAAAAIATGAERVLVVASDAHPSGERHDDFPYASVGAAMLVGREPDPARGLGRLAIADDHAGGDVVAGYALTDDARGRERIRVERSPDYEARLLALAARLGRARLEREHLDDALLATSLPTPGFGASLARALGVPVESALAVHGVERDPHTSTLAIAYHQASQAGRLGSRPVLFLAAGAGPSASSIVHRP